MSGPCCIIMGSSYCHSRQGSRYQTPLSSLAAKYHAIYHPVKFNGFTYVWSNAAHEEASSVQKIHFHQFASKTSGEPLSQTVPFRLSLKIYFPKPLRILFQANIDEIAVCTHRTSLAGEIPHRSWMLISLELSSAGVFKTCMKNLRFERQIFCTHMCMWFSNNFPENGNKYLTMWTDKEYFALKRHKPSKFNHQWSNYEINPNLNK